MIDPIAFAGLCQDKGFYLPDPSPLPVLRKFINVVRHAKLRIGVFGAKIQSGWPIGEVHIRNPLLQKVDAGPPYCGGCHIIAQSVKAGTDTQFNQFLIRKGFQVFARLLCFNDRYGCIIVDSFLANAPIGIVRYCTSAG